VVKRSMPDQQGVVVAPNGHGVDQNGHVNAQDSRGVALQGDGRFVSYTSGRNYE
jgi:hypothetical protein